MTEIEIINPFFLCRQIENLAFGHDPGTRYFIEPRRFDIDPAAYEALKQRVREIATEYDLSWEKIQGFEAIITFGKSPEVVVDTISYDDDSEQIAFMLALKEALEKKEPTADETEETKE